MSQFWSVPREWEGQTCFILAGGPSLFGFDATVLAGRRCIVINNSYLLHPYADVLYFCDRSWWKEHRKQVREVFKGGRVVTIGNCGEDSMLLQLRNTGAAGLEPNPTSLRHGLNSGYQAIGLAYHFGVKRIVLLGYDMKITADRTHWHAGHPSTQRDSLQMALTQNMLPRFNSLVEPLYRAGVDVINCTPDSALTCWPMGKLEDELK